MSTTAKVERATAETIDTSRRQFLRRIAIAGAGSAGLALLSEKPGQAATIVAQSMWVHGHSVQPQTPEATSSMLRSGSALHVEQVSGGGWFHFAIPTPLIVADTPMRIDRVLVAFGTSGTNTIVTSINVFDGAYALIKHGFEIPVFGDHSRSDTLAGVTVPGQPVVTQAIGVTVRVEFAGTPAAPGRIDFIAAGADFV